MAREVTLRFLGDAGQLHRTFAAVEAQSARTFGQMQAASAGAASTMASKMSAATAAVGAAGATMRRSGKTLARNVTLPMAVIGAVGLKTAIDYERSMNVLQSISGATGEQMASFGKLAQALGADLTLPGTSAADATQAMVELAKAGLSIEDSMGAAKGVLQLSAAGGLDNATAASVAANALNAFKLSGDQAVRVADLLAGAANGSSAEVAELADSLSQGASVFAQAGIPIEDFVSSAALLANVGIKGSDAGTSLKSMLLKLQNPSKQAAESLKAMGVNIYDAQGQMRPFRDIIDSFTGAMAGMNQEQRDAAMGTIFGSDAVRSANAVLLAGVDAFDRMKAVTTEQGAAAKLAAAQNKGLGGAIDGLKSAMETLMLRVLVPALPVLTGFVTALANFLPKLMEIPKPVLIAAAAFGGLLVAAGPLLAIFGALLSPLGLVAAGVAAVGTAIYAALNPEKAQAAFAVLGTWIQTQGPVLVAKLATWAQAFTEWMLPMIPVMLHRLGLILGAIGTWVLDVGLPALSEKMRVWIPAFVGWVAEVGPPLLLELGKLLTQLMIWIQTEALPKIAKAMAGLAAGVVGGIGNTVLDVLPGGGGGKPGAPPKPGGGRGGPVGGFVQGAAQAVFGPAAGFLGLADGGLLLGVNRPTPLLVGEGGKEDVLAVPHSKGGLGGLGGVSQTNIYNGVPLEEAMQRSQRDLGWRMALAGRR